MAEAHQVAVVDNLSSGFRANVNPAARFYEVDIRDYKALQRVFEQERPEVVNHHAAQMDVRRSTREPMYDAECNIIGSLNLLQLCLNFQVRKVIYISTGGAVYGNPEYLPVDEEHPIRPLCEYGISKHTVEHYLDLYAKRSGLCYTVLRYPNVYGPRQNPHGEAGVVAIFTEKVIRGEPVTFFGKGKPTRDYVYISDIADINLRALTQGDNTIYNVGSGVGTSVQEIFEIICEALGSSTEVHYKPLRPGEVTHIYLKATKAAKELQWKPRIALKDGIFRTVAWYQDPQQKPSPH